MGDVEEVSSDASSAKAPRALKYSLHPPTLLPNGIQYSIHEVPRAFARELVLVLPDVDLSGVFIVPTCQHAVMDLVATGPDVAKEKDDLLEKFTAWSQAVCTDLRSQGYWGDYVDPCSGYAVLTPYSRVVYPEVDAAETLLRYRTYSAGGCKVLSHPTWGTAVYPATLFAKGPLDAVVRAIERASTAANSVIPPVAAPGGSSAPTGSDSSTMGGDH